MSLILLLYYFRSTLKRSRRLLRAIFCGLTVAISNNSRSCSIIFLSRILETASPNFGLFVLSIVVSTCESSVKVLARYLAREALAASGCSSGSRVKMCRWWRLSVRFCVRFGWSSAEAFTFRIFDSWKVISYDIQEISANLIARKYLGTRM